MPPFVFSVLFITPFFTVLSGYHVSPETHKGLKRATRVNIHFFK